MLTLFKQGADYAPHITANPPEFKKLSTTLTFWFQIFFEGLQLIKAQSTQSK